MKRSAVIDIGSNSVRLVIYRLVRSSALPHFNEKVLAGLGRGVTETKRLSKEGRKLALAALSRYEAILSALGVKEVRVVATAAVRVAEDGDQFVKEAEEILGQHIIVLSGMDEAKLSAFGVIAGTFQAEGIVGDLGGSSLEFSRINAGKTEAGETHLLGPLSIDPDMDVDDRRKWVRAALKKSPLIKSKPGGVFYAVGGAWRAFAKLHIQMQDYPLHALHGYRLEAREVSQFARQTIVSSPVTRSHIRSATGRSPQNIVHAAVVLEQVFDIGRFEQLYVSANGVREGVLAEANAANEGDPLIDGIAATAHLDETQYAFGDALHKFVRPVLPIDGDLFGHSEKQERIDRAACMLADSGARLHPDHRANLAYDLALRGAYTGATHAQRAFIALAVGCRYYKSFRRPERDRVLMPQSRADRARQLGALMRLGGVFSGRSAPLLEFASLEQIRGKLILNVEESRAAMVSETVRKRLAQAAHRLKVDHKINIKKR